jgi:hypothetical protein
MKRSTQLSASPGAGYSGLQKPVFAPELPSIEEVKNLFFMELQHESYDASGAPRLQFGVAGDDTLALTRVRIAESDMSPALRQVFIPEHPDKSSFMLEAADGEPGLVILSLGAPVGPEVQASVIVAPFTTLAQISQGDHDGLLQINPPLTETVCTTLILTAGETGYFKYRTSGTSVSFSALTSDEITDAIRRVDGEIADQIAAVLAQFAFEVTPPDASSRALVCAGLALSPTTKKVLIALLQVTGLLATGGGGILGLTATAGGWLSKLGTGLSMAGGLVRGVTGLFGTFAGTRGAGSPVVTGATYDFVLTNDATTITLT